MDVNKAKATLETLSLVGAKMSRISIELDNLIFDKMSVASLLNRSFENDLSIIQLRAMHKDNQNEMQTIIDQIYELQTYIYQQGNQHV